MEIEVRLEKNNNPTLQAINSCRDISDKSLFENLD